MMRLDKEVHEMHPNYAIWMIGGLEPEPFATARERAQRHELRERRRTSRPSLISRLRGTTQPKAAETDLVCCPA